VQNPNVAMALALLAGFGFGFMLERAGFGDSRKLLGQFFGNEMTMLKVMFSAVATAVVLTAALDGVGLIDLRALGTLVTTETWLWPMIAGGLLIGVAIVFSGYCPGTSFVGMASGKLDAVVTYAGVIVGQLSRRSSSTRRVDRFFRSGAKGHLFLYDLLGIPAAVLALAIAGVAIGSFLFRRVGGAEGGRRRRPGFAGAPEAVRLRGVRGVALFAVVTLALPSGAGAVQRSAAGSASRSWRAGSSRSPGRSRSSTSGAPGLAASNGSPARSAWRPRRWRLGLDVEPPGRDLVVVGAGELEAPPAGAMAFPGRVLLLSGGFESWRGWALTPPSPPEADAPVAEKEAFRVRAGVHAAMTGVKPAAPAAPAAGGAAPKRKKAGGGGGGCGG